MSKVIFKWNGPQVLSIVRKGVKEGMKAAAEFTEEKMKELVSIPYPPASEPGQPPHLRTGDFRDAITHEVSSDGKIARIGIAKAADCPYARLLEIGTDEMAPRPWARTTLIRYGKEIVKVLGRKAKLTVGVSST